MKKRNKHGLKRRIDSPTARVIRDRCGFGCVICGLWLYTYEHIDPEFKDARNHDPDKICLLCCNHHGEVTAGRLSKQYVIEAYKRPKCKELGFADCPMEIGEVFNLTLGNLSFLNPGDVLKIDGQTLLGANPS